MKKIIVILLLLSAILTIEDLSAQTKNKFAVKETWELGGSFSFSSVKYVNDGNTSNNTLTTIEFAPYAGYLITDGFELGVIPSVEYSSYGSSDVTAFAIYVAPAYNFDTKSIAYPYVQGAIGYNSISGKNMTTVSGLAWRLEGGAKINIAGSSLLKFGFYYDEKTLNSSGHTGGRDGINTFSFVAGFSVFLK